MIVRPSALGQLLRRAPVAPTSAAALLRGHEAYAEFRRIVERIFPEAAAEILAAGAGTRDRESARVWAFLGRVEAQLFPVHDVDEYEAVCCGVPFIRNSWGYDRFHEVDLPLGELLLFGLSAQPYAEGYDTRVALFDALDRHLPRELLDEVPAAGLTPLDLHQRLDGTPYEAAALFADWLWGETGSLFLDLDDEEVLPDADWTPENVRDLAAQWDLARDVLSRITELANRLERSPAAEFGRLLDAALGRDEHLDYLRQRRLYACEITQEGLVPVGRDERDRDHAVAVPVGVAA